MYAKLSVGLNRLTQKAHCENIHVVVWYKAKLFPMFGPKMRIRGLGEPKKSGGFIKSIGLLG